MGKILEYNDLGGPPNVNDLLFIGDYNESSTNPTTKHVSITNLNKKYQIWAADGGGLKITDDGGNYGLFIKDGGNVGVGTNTPDYKLDLETTAVATANLRIYSNATNGYPHLVMKNDAQTWSIYAPHGNFTGAGVADLFSIYNGSSHVLIIQTNGNVGIGVNPSSATVGYQLEVVGDLAATGTNNVILDPSTGEVKSQSGLFLEKSASQDVHIVGDTSAAAIFAKSSNKRVGINELSPDARLHVYESSGADNVALKLENRVASGSPNSILRFTRTVGSTSLEQQMVWDGTNLGIRNVSAVTLGSDSVNFRAGSLDVGATGFTRKFNVTDSNNIVGEFNSSDNNGTKILIRNTSNAAAADQHSLIAFPNKIGSNEIANWMTGAYKDNANPDNNYFMIHYSSQAAPTDGQYVFDTNTTNNAMRLDTSGNVRFKGTMEASAYYDQGGNTAGNYCRGRFLQTFSVPYYASALQPFSPLLAPPFDRTDDTEGNTITAKWASIAPHDGRILSIRAAAKNNQSSQTNMTLYVYTGSSLPAGTKLTTTDSAYVQGFDDEGTTANSQLHLAADANQKVTLGYSNFAGSNAGGQSNLDFSQGDYLMFSFDCDSGNANLNVQFTVEFYIDDTL
jgi:hypothetical protein